MNKAHDLAQQLAPAVFWSVEMDKVGCARNHDNFEGRVHQIVHNLIAVGRTSHNCRPVAK
jgi:hypothetical protein